MLYQLSYVGGARGQYSPGFFAGFLAVPAECRGMKRLLAAGALAAFFVASAHHRGVELGGQRQRRDDGVDADHDPAVTTQATTTTPDAGQPPRQAHAVGAYDPEGDDHENDDLAPLAVDGDTSTFWKTEHYHSFGKTGVGLVLDAGKPRPLARVLVSTDTAGASAEIEVGSNPNGPFHLVTAVKQLSGTTGFKLAARTKARYVVVWVTSLPARRARRTSPKCARSGRRPSRRRRRSRKSPSRHRRHHRGRCPRRRRCGRDPVVARVAASAAA